MALVIGFIATFLMPRIFSASTTVKIDRVVPKVVNNQMAATEGINDPQFYQTQYELIRSRSLAAERVVLALNLAQTDFIPQPTQGLLSRALVTTRKWTRGRSALVRSRPLSVFNAD